MKNLFYAVLLVSCYVLMAVSLGMAVKSWMNYSKSVYKYSGDRHELGLSK